MKKSTGDGAALLSNGIVPQTSEKSNTLDEKKSMDDTIEDELFELDEDLSEDEATSKRFLDEFIKTSPQEATLTMSRS